MTEKQYTTALKRELRSLNREDRQTILDDCAEHFRLAAASGQSETEIARSLGTPVELAEEAREELGIEKFRETPAGNVARISLASISLLLFNAIVVVGPYAGLVGGLAGLWAGAVAIVASGIAAVLAIPLEPLLRLWIPMNHIAGVMPRVAFFFGGIAVTALGLLTCIGMIYLTKWFVDATVRYAKMTWRIAAK